MVAADACETWTAFIATITPLLSIMPLLLLAVCMLQQVQTTEAAIINQVSSRVGIHCLQCSDQ
jgi:hypothetical protein